MLQAIVCTNGVANITSTDFEGPKSSGWQDIEVESCSFKNRGAKNA